MADGESRPVRIPPPAARLLQPQLPSRLPAIGGVDLDPDALDPADFSARRQGAANPCQRVQDYHPLPYARQPDAPVGVAHIGHADPKFIFTAAIQASKVADFILSFSRTEEPEPEEALAE